MNQTNRFRRSRIPFILCVALIAAMALALIGCNDATVPVPEPSDPSERTVKGEGATSFYFTVVDGNEQAAYFKIRTDKTIVGEALQELGLLAGDEGPFGLYVKTVNGLTVDYDTDGAYWAFYEGGKYAGAGVDKTTIRAGATYMFKVEKG